MDSGPSAQPASRSRRPLSLLVGGLLAVACVLAYDNHVLRDSIEMANRAPAPAPAPQCKQTGPSKLATRYLGDLHGIEIGASYQNSFHLPRSMNVDFQDQPAEYWQSKGCPRAIVNIVAQGDALPFKDGTLDYVLSSHVIEHFFDPVKALREWHRVIKPGGFIFVIAPHRDRTFDRHREPTPVQELLDRSNGIIRMSNYAKPTGPAALAKFGKEKLGEYYQVMPQILVRETAGAKLEEGWEFYKADDYHHWSVWRTADFVELARQLKFEVVEVQDVDDKVGNGFSVVIKK